MHRFTVHAYRRVVARPPNWCGSVFGKSLHACIGSRIVGAVNDTDWPTYLAALSTNQSEISRAAGVSTATVSRWFSRSTQPLAPQVIAVARAYAESPVVALIAAGYLTRAEVEQEVRLTPGMSLAEFSELEIAQELVRRIEAGETTDMSEAPLEVDHPAWANVGGDPHPDFAEDHQLPGNQVPAVIRVEGGTVYFDVNGTSFAAPKKVSELVEFWDYLGDIEREVKLDYAAKSSAIEVEEDQHTP